MNAPTRPIAPWYLAYLILGLLTSGLLPFLLPLMVADVSHQLGTVAYVSGAYNLGLLPAPALGALAERRQLYRPMFFGGFVVLGLALAAFPSVSSLLPWFLLALTMGVATGAIATVATLFIVDFTPRSEWELRIGWLQSFNDAGQLAGLLLASVFADGQFGTGFMVAACLALLAALVGGIGLPVRERSRTRRRNPIGHLRLQPLLRPTQLGPALGGLLQQSHHLQWAALRSLPKALRAPFGRFLLAWAAYNFGVAAFFAYYPLVMRQLYGIPPTVTAVAYAAAAGIGIFLFVAASKLAIRYGSRAVFQSGLALRLFGFLLLGVPLIMALPETTPTALLGFLLAMLAWPVLSVSGTALAASLTPIGEGAAIGLLGASSALATVVGTFASGPLVHAFGYGIVLPLAIAGLAVAELLMLGGRSRPGEVTPTGQKPGDTAGGFTQGGPEARRID